MKIDKKLFVKSISDEILRNISSRIRFLIREELEISKKLIKKQLLEELQQEFPKKRKYTKHKQEQSFNIDTGNSILNTILEDINVDEEKPLLSTKFSSATKIAVKDNKKKSIIKNKLYEEKDGEIYNNFDPMTMDASAMDWSNIIDALDKNDNYLPGQE